MNMSVKEFITKLKTCALDSNFTCPFDDSHNLTAYHMINRVRSGVINKNLQQELLQKSDTLTNFCETFEQAQSDRDKLSAENIVISGISQDDLAAATSSYKKSKR